MTIFIGAGALVALLLMIGVEILLLRRRKRKARRSIHRHARRQPLLEDRMRDALEEPQTQYGEIFTSFTVWKRDQETRMELFTGPPWMQLNEFTRSIVVRHIWRALEKLAKGSVVVIDSPPLEWTAQTDQAFDDRGIDPWGEGVQPAGSQFVKEEK